MSLSEGPRDRIHHDVPLQPDEVVALFRGFIRHPSLMDEGLRLGLTAEHFNGPGEYRLAVLFTVLHNAFEQYGTYTKEMILTSLRSNQTSGQVAIGPADIEFLLGDETNQGFISETFDEPRVDAEAAKAERRFCENLLRRFMRVRLIKQSLQHQLGAAAAASAPTNIAELLGRFHRVSQRVEHLGADVRNSAMMPAFGEQIELPPPAIPVGLPWLDQYTGGIRTGDVIGVLGPYGGGKSTLLTVAAVRIAHHFALNGENKLSVFIGYEDGGAKWNHMFWSAAARIERKVFTDYGTDIWAQFSTRETLKDYDRLLPENRNGEIMFGERERWEAAIPWLNRHFVFLDFSCNSDTGGQGAGGVPEIVNALERLAEERGMEIGFVAIDYAGILVERMMGSRSTDLKDIIRPIKKVPDDLRTLLAVPTGATVMLAHQLAPGDIKGRPVYKYVGHDDASGSKSFAENVHSCMGINHRDHSTNVSTIYWSKIRALRPVSPYGLIKMDDHVVDVHLVNDDYVACPTTRAIIRKGDVRVVNPYAENGARDNEQRRGWSTDTMPGDF
jgi:hypothetical protein